MKYWKVVTAERDSVTARGYWRLRYDFGTIVRPRPTAAAYGYGLFAFSAERFARAWMGGLAPGVRLIEVACTEDPLPIPRMTDLSAAVAFFSGVADFRATFDEVVLDVSSSRLINATLPAGTVCLPWVEVLT